MTQDDREQTPEIKPEIVFIFELVRDVEAGRIRVPNFQRQFVWRRAQMTDLLDSIRRQFPIGSILVWETDTQLSSRAWVGPVPVARVRKGVAAYVLDGQQRLSTLVGTMRKPRPDDAVPENETDLERWKVWYNAEDDQFEHLREGEPKESFHLPMASLMDTVGFLGECQRMMQEGGAKGQDYVARSQAIARSFQSYKLPVIRIRNTDLSKAVEIFARLNTRGQSITADQMVAALTYAEDPAGEEAFNLAKMIDRLLERADEVHFGGTDRTVMLRACLAALGEDVYHTDWTRISSEALQRRAAQLQDRSLFMRIDRAFEASFTFLAGMGIRTGRLLPYAMQLVILTAFFYERPDPTEGQRDFLRRWIWVSSFIGFFASVNPSRVEKIIKEFRLKVVREEIPYFLDTMDLEEPAQPLPETFDMRSARSRCLLNVLLSLEPRNRQGEVITDPWRTVFAHGPEALCKIFSTPTGDPVLDGSPANRMIRVDMADRRQGKQWLREVLPKVEEDLRHLIMRSHGIPSEGYEDLMNNRAGEFLRKRRDHLMQLEEAFMEREVVVRPTIRIPRQAPIDTE